MRKTRKEELIEQTGDAHWWFKNGGSKHSDLKEIKPLSCLYMEILSYRLHMLRRFTHVRLTREIGKVSDFVIRIEIPFWCHHLIGEDAARILEFLAFFKRDDKI